MPNPVQMLVITLVFALNALSTGFQRSSMPALEGYESGGVYINDFFEFRFKSPVGWEAASQAKKEAVLKSLNASAPSADNRILVMLVRSNDAESLPDTVAVFSARSSASDGAEGAAVYFKRDRAISNQTVVITPLRMVQFGGRTFAREDLQSKGKAHFMADLAIVKSGYLLSFQAHSSSREHLDKMVDALSGSVQFK